jgi:hypothetical protein
MLGAVLKFEVNRPLLNWYGKLDEPADMKKALDAVKSLNCKEIIDRGELIAETEKYVKSAEADFETSSGNATQRRSVF